MKEFIFEKLKTLNVKDLNKLEKYISFCIDNQDEIGDNHHILPRSLFIEFSNLNEFKWNKSKLKPANHYLAHSFLHDAIENYSVACAWYAMNNKNFKNNETIELLGSEKYDELISKRNKMCSEHAKNKVMAKRLDTGEIIKVEKSVFDNDSNLVGSTTGISNKSWLGKINVINEDGQIIKIDKNCFDKNIHSGQTKNKTTFKDIFGNITHCAVDDPRVKSGELFGISKGRKFKPRTVFKKINIYDSNNNLIFECNGNFQQTCKDNKLPTVLLSKSNKENNQINSKINYKYNGWYARTLKKLNKTSI